MSRKEQSVELLSPSGDWSSLKSAIEAGCDGVYFGIKGMNMRHGASNFDIMEIKKVMKYLHSFGKKGYLALNVPVYNNEVKKTEKILKEAKRTHVDAVILWDMAVLSMARKAGLNIHISTQASISNFEAFKYYASLGAERAVLARECTIKDIKDIIRKAKKEKIKCTVETFVHGAMCVSVSGRCFLSHHTFGSSANRGECLQPCRREYKIYDVDGECEYLLGRDYILSPKDLCTVYFIDKLIEAGIRAFKIEGRMRSPEYVSTVTSVYREAIDAYYQNKLDNKLKKNLLKKLQGSFNRGFSAGFYLGMPEDLGGTLNHEYKKVYIGEVRKYYKKINVAEIEVKHLSLKTGDRILISGSKTPANFLQVSEMEIDHKPVKKAAKGVRVGLKVPFEVSTRDKVFMWKEK